MYKKLTMIFNRLLKDIPEIEIYEGFGYCGYCSKLLSLALEKEKINHTLLIGEGFKETSIAKQCIKNNIKLIRTFPDDESLYADIKKHLIQRGNKLPKRIGHAVIKIDNYICDLTAGQFGLPKIYEESKFKEIWSKIYIADITIDEESLDTFKIKEIKKT